MRKSSPGQRRAAADAAAGWPMRVAKAMARAGLCSRREAERWIEQGRVRVNGSVLKSPARDVSEQDRITVDDSPLPAVEPPRLWRYHKPRGLVTTHRDPDGRPTVFAALPEHFAMCHFGRRRRDGAGTPARLEHGHGANMAKNCWGHCLATPKYQIVLRKGLKGLNAPPSELAPMYARGSRRWPQH